MTATDRPAATGLPKAITGIAGLDEVTKGGLPRDRTTLVCGGPGCGKTLLGLQFLYTGLVEHSEPGVLISFEETAAELTANVASFGWDLQALEESGQLVIDDVRLESRQIEQVGEWDLDGLILRIGAAVDATGAKRVVLDTPEVLFAALGDSAILRSELRRLFRWLSDGGLTTVITAERGDSTLTRFGLEEYVSDCVIVLDHRVVDQLSTRRLRVLKYRGSEHGPDEYPFLIGSDGIVVLPATSMGLEHQVSSERVSSGVPELDAMLDGGYFRGSSVLIAGTAGCGKTTLGAAFLAAATERGEKAMMFSFEESPDQIVRNMASVGIDLRRARESGLLEIRATRMSQHGLESHLAEIQHAVDEFDPRFVFLDPLSAMGGEGYAVVSMLARLIDFVKGRGITAVMTTLLSERSQTADFGVSSLVDTMLSVTNLEGDRRRERALTIVKSRGMAHSNEIRQFQLSNEGFVVEGPHGEVGPG
jgi:circadian clock protein KaiC